MQTPVQEEEIDRAFWGELESESEEEETSDEEDEEDDADASGLVTPGETSVLTPPACLKWLAFVKVAR